MPKKKKPKKPKQRIPVAPPSRRHKTKKDYKRVKKVDIDMLATVCILKDLGYT